MYACPVISFASILTLLLLLIILLSCLLCLYHLCCCGHISWHDVAWIHLVTFFAFALINFSKIPPLRSFPNDLGGWNWLSLSLFPLKPVIFPLFGYILCIRKIPNMTKQDSVLQTAWHGSKMHKFNPDEGLWNKHIQHSGHSPHITWLKGLYLPIRPFDNVQKFVSIRNLFTSEYMDNHHSSTMVTMSTT